jgi:hypothetical protein
MDAMTKLHLCALLLALACAVPAVAGIKTMDWILVQAQAGAVEAAAVRVADYTEEHASQLDPYFVSQMDAFISDVRLMNERLNNFKRKSRRRRHSVTDVNDLALKIDAAIYHLPVMAAALPDWEKTKAWISEINHTMRLHPVAWPSHHH